MYRSYLDIDITNAQATHTQGYQAFTISPDWIFLDGSVVGMGGVINVSVSMFYNKNKHWCDHSERCLRQGIRKFILRHNLIIANSKQSCHLSLCDKRD